MSSQGASESTSPQAGAANVPKTRLPDIQQNTGALNFSYPVAIPPGRNHLQPDLKLTYSSQGQGEGSIYGSNWSDNIPYIQRNAKMGVDKLYSTSTPQYFISSLDDELATTTVASAYVARTENGTFNAYTFTSSTNQWLMKDKNGTQYKFGYASTTRQDDPNDASHVFKWMLEEVRDTNNNYIKYTYTKDSGQIYPSSIIYTGSSSTDGVFEIDFATGTRMDIAASTQSGFFVLTKNLINRIDVKASGSLVHQYVLGYGTGDNGTRSLLITAVESGKDESGSTVTVPTTTFSFPTQTPGWATSTSWQPPVSLVSSSFTYIGYKVMDVNGDGLPDIFRSFPDGTSMATEAYLNNGVDGWTTSTSWQPPVSLVDVSFKDVYKVMDVNGDGLPDIFRSYPDAGGTMQTETYLDNGVNGWTTSTSWRPPVSLFDSSFVEIYKVMDVNGDGLPDIFRSYPDAGGNMQTAAYLNNGVDGWTTSTLWQPPVSLFSSSFTDIGYKVMDVNGDGLPDIFRSFQDVGGGSVAEAYLNNGSTGWTTSTAWQPPVSLDNSSFTDTGYRIADVNGDGLPDIFRSYPDAQAHILTEAYLNNGVTGWTTSTAWYPSISLVSSSQTDLGYKIMDVNGDGLPDIFRSYPDGTTIMKEAYQNKASVNSLVKRVTQSQGGSTSFTYKPVAQYRNEGGGIANQTYMVIPTVSNVVVDDAFGNVATTTYQYNGGHYYFNGGFDTQFAGFASTTVTDPVGNVTKTYFHQADSSDTGHGEYSDNYFKFGKPYRVEKYDASGNLYQKTINKWDSSAVANSDAGFVKLAQTVDATYDGDASHKDMAETYAYDSANGNQTQKVEYGQVTGSDDGTFSDTGTDKLTTDISYASSATSSVIGAVKQVTVTDQNSNKVKEAKYYYDSSAFGAVGLGNQTKEEDWKTGSTYVSSTKAYNALGLVTSATDPRGKVTTYAYDSYNLYPATVTDPLNHLSRYLYDYSNGQPKQATDANGLISQTTFDGLDRVTQKLEPDLTTSSTMAVVESFAYTDTPGAVSVKDLKQMSSTSTVDSYSYFDGLNRLIQSRTAAEAANTFETKDLSYDTRGLLQKESLPYFSTGNARTTATTSAALLTSYAYDALQRVKTTSNILGTATTTYSDWTTTVTDPNGKTKDLKYDAYKRLNEVDEHNDASTYTTLYEYDGNGDLTKITDALSNVRNFTYDGLGRRLTAQDLHTPADATYGTWTYAYDDTGNLTQQVDPKSQTVNYAYDDLNRALTEDYTGATGTEVTYTYDSCSYGIGSLCTASSTSIKITNAYNPRHLLATATSTIDGTNYATSYTYDRQGNQLTITNPDSSQIKYDYAGDHFLNAVSKKETTDSGFVSIVSNFDYAPNEQVSSATFANGVTVANTYDPAKLYRLTRKVSTLPNASKAQDITYTYDAVGNITQLVEAGATNTRRTVSYGYDDLYRLTSATATGTPSGISGYAETYAYDALGNFLTKSDQGAYAYASGTSIYANPDAAITIGSSTLAYDNNGNLISLTGSGSSSSSTSSSTSTGWSVNGGTWQRRKQVSVDYTKVNGGSNLTNFSMLFSAVDPELKTTGNGGYVASSTGADIFFTSSDGSTKLSHEIEKYTASTGELAVWVKIPTLSASTNTVLYVYYGNASSTNQQSVTSTWDGNTKGVWHLNGAFTDSTTNGNNGTNTGSTDVAGRAANGRAFNGSNQRVTAPNASSLKPTTAITMSLWVKRAGAQGDYAKPIWFGQNDAGPWGPYGVQMQDVSDTVTEFHIASTSTDYYIDANATSTLSSTSTWYFLAGTYDGATIKYFINGSLQGSESATFNIGNYDSTNGLGIGDAYETGAPWNGSIDEVKIANTARTSGWITTEYNNLNATSTFYSIGAGASTSTSSGGGGSSSTSTSGSTFTWDYLNRLTQAATGASTSTYAYDVSGERVKSSVVSATSTVTTYYPSKFYNVTTDGTTTKHVFANGLMVATITTATSSSGSGSSSIALDATSTSITNGYNNTITKTWTHTTGSGSNRLLVLSADLWQDVPGTGTITSASYNGVALTKATSTRQTGMASEVWYLSNPASGSNTMSVTVTGDTDAIKLNAGTFTGVTQSSPVDVSKGAIGTTGNPTISLTTLTANDLLIATLSRYSTTDASTNRTSLYKDKTSSTLGAASYQVASSTGSYSDTYTGSASQDWSMLMVGFKPALTGGGSTSTTSTVSTILTDHLGGSNVVTNASGTITELSDYLPFGATRIDDQSGSNEQRKFIGEQYDPESGLNYLNARYLHSSFGRFLSEDPEVLSNPTKFLKDPQQLNYYSYGRDNPITQSDPSGRCVGPYVVACIGAGAGAAFGVGGQYMSDVINNIAQNGLKGEDFYRNLSSPSDYARSAVVGAVVGGVTALAAESGAPAVRVAAVAGGSNFGTEALVNFATGKQTDYGQLATRSAITFLTAGLLKSAVPDVPGRLPSFGTSAFFTGAHTQAAAAAEAFSQSVQALSQSAEIVFKNSIGSLSSNLKGVAQTQPGSSLQRFKKLKKITQ